MKALIRFIALSLFIVATLMFVPLVGCGGVQGDTSVAGEEAGEEEEETEEQEVDEEEIVVIDFADSTSKSFSERWVQVRNQYWIDYGIKFLGNEKDARIIVEEINDGTDEFVLARSRDFHDEQVGVDEGNLTIEFSDDRSFVGMLVGADPSIYLHDPNTYEITGWDTVTATLVGFDENQNEVARDEKDVKLGLFTETLLSIELEQPAIRWLRLGLTTPSGENVYAFFVDDITYYKISTSATARTPEDKTKPVIEIVSPEQDAILESLGDFRLIAYVEDESDLKWVEFRKMAAHQALYSRFSISTETPNRHMTKNGKYRIELDSGWLLGHISTFEGYLPTVGEWYVFTIEISDLAGNVATKDVSVCYVKECN